MIMKYVGYFMKYPRQLITKAKREAAKAAQGGISDEDFLKIVNDKDAYLQKLGKTPRKKV